MYQIKKLENRYLPSNTCINYVWDGKIEEQKHDEMLLKIHYEQFLGALHWFEILPIQLFSMPYLCVVEGAVESLVMVVVKEGKFYAAEITCNKTFATDWDSQKRERKKYCKCFRYLTLNLSIKNEMTYFSKIFVQNRINNFLLISYFKSREE